MDNKNVFIAGVINVSFAFGSCFFWNASANRKALPQQQEEKVTENNITPNINQNVKDKTISRVDAINNFYFPDDINNFYIFKQIYWCIR